MALAQLDYRKSEIDMVLAADEVPKLRSFNGRTFERRPKIVCGGQMRARIQWP